MIALKIWYPPPFLFNELHRSLKFSEIQGNSDISQLDSHVQFTCTYFACPRMSIHARTTNPRISTP